LRSHKNEAAHPRQAFTHRYRGIRADKRIYCAVIASIAGLHLSEVRPAGEVHEGITFGSSLLFTFLSNIVLNADPDKFDVILHPVAFADG